MSRYRLFAGALGAGLIGALAFAVPASAHVTVAAPGVQKGGYGVVAVRVPTESDTASTTKIVLQLPTAQPFLDVAVQPTAGWTATTTTAKLAKPEKTDDGDTVDSAISTVTWTATAGGIKPGQFQQFFLDAGPFPDTATVTFKAIQYYSDGAVVKWIEEPAPGSTVEPEHPAPTLQLAAAPAASPSVSVSTAPMASSSGSNSGSSDTGALVLAIIALVVALGGVALGVVSRARSSSSSSGSSSGSGSSAGSGS